MRSETFIPRERAIFSMQRSLLRFMKIVQISFLTTPSVCEKTPDHISSSRHDRFRYVVEHSLVLSLCLAF
jgi:hypothetical protein